jgi:hypothetical protein
MSARGTFRKLSSQCVMSAVEGRAEVVNGARTDAIGPQRTSALISRCEDVWSGVGTMPAQAKPLDVRWKLVGHLAYP